MSIGLHSVPWPITSLECERSGNGMDLKQHNLKMDYIPLIPISPMKMPKVAKRSILIML